MSEQLWDIFGLLLGIGNVAVALVLRDRKQSLICFVIGIACLTGAMFP